MMALSPERPDTNTPVRTVALKASGAGEDKRFAMYANRNALS
jgi:hypothetical protein